ncbi:glycosyltransferase family 61 protein [Phenylobacterium sp. J426]|uniref:glycosyltransferase family 61 protein n=1 Tax=Phenylobacterium sp. J426 TaxID=2898439 RepID=UPI002151FB41|nr:glycosyltransferase family 61 protein [Phenylobacterium sp. J426]MCR5873397.1 glycosyltransferase family 61 protein [Phenylobacterium sp. J426]
MIVDELRDQPAYLLSPAVLMAGSALAFSTDLQTAYSAAPFDPKREHLQEEMIRTLVRTPVGDQIGFEFAQTPDIAAHLSRDAIPLNLLHSGNYFHFLVEALPNLLVLLQNDLVGPNSLIVSGLLHSNMWSALQLVLRGRETPILQLRKHQAVSADRAILLPPAWHASELLGGAISDSTYDVTKIQLLRDSFRPLWPDGANDLKLFIRRASGQRIVSNAQEVEQAAIQAGYHVIDPGQFSFEEQVRIFQSASHVAGPTGAWLANLVFTREDARVSVFYPETGRVERTIWRLLAEICGVAIDEIYCPVTLYRERQPIHSDFLIPAEALAESLRV